MADVTILTGSSRMPAYVAEPAGAGAGPWPGVVVVHDALGLTTDARRQADWLAGEGYLTVVPDLFHRNGHVRCMVATMRAAFSGEGVVYQDLAAARAWLLAREVCTGRVGVIGFCMGGGLALLAAEQFDVSSVNYGRVPRDAADRLIHACPVVGSYGATDKVLRGAPARLERALTANGVPHDIKVYPGAGHDFLTMRPPEEEARWMAVSGRLAGMGAHEPSAVDARRRILAFFARHLGAPSGDRAGDAAIG